MSAAAKAAMPAMPSMAAPISARQRARENGIVLILKPQACWSDRSRGMRVGRADAPRKHSALSRKDQCARRSWRRQVIQAFGSWIAAGDLQPDRDRPDVNDTG